MNHILRNGIIVVLAVLAVGGVWVYGQQTLRGIAPQASSTASSTVMSKPIIDTVSITPNTITPQLSTPVTITAHIPDPTLIPNSVNLLQVGVSGTQQSLVGQLYDDGSHGDLTAGDHIYTLQTNFTEATTGQINLQVSAAFRDVLRRVIKTLQPLSISQPRTFINTDIGLTMSYPADWVIQQSGNSTDFSNDPSGTLPLENLAFLEIHFMPAANPTNLSIDDWFTHFSPQLPSPPLSRVSISVNGNAAVRIEMAEIGSQSVLYISRGGDIIEVTYNTTASQYVGEYEAIINSITFVR